MTRRESAFLLAIVLVFGAIFFNLWRKIFRVYPEARVEMRQAFQQIPLGTTRVQVRNHFAASRYSELTLRIWEPSIWYVKTPAEFGANNWFLYLEWDGNELVAKRVRTNDGFNIRPHDSPPPDEVRAGWKSPRDFR